MLQAKQLMANDLSVSIKSTQAVGCQHRSAGLHHKMVEMNFYLNIQKSSHDLPNKLNSIFFSTKCTFKSVRKKGTKQWLEKPHKKKAQTKTCRKDTKIHLAQKPNKPGIKIRSTTKQTQPLNYAKS